MICYFDYQHIFDTLGFTVYGQLILKWQFPQFGPPPVESVNKLKFLLWPLARYAWIAHVFWLLLLLLTGVKSSCQGYQRKALERV